MIRGTELSLKSVFQKYMEKVIYFCCAENISPNLAVHEIRKLFKRMRALLKFFSHSSFPFFKEFKTQMLVAGKSISELRESAVNIQIFDKLFLKNSLVPERKLKLVKERLIEKNKLLVGEKFEGRDVTSEILGLFKDYESQLKIFEQECPTKEQVITRIFKSFNKANFAFQNLDSEYEGEELHELRKKMKILWYQMDFIKYLNPKYLGVKSEQIHKITEHLGEDHDLYVFLKEIDSGAYDLEEDDLETIKNQIGHLREINRTKLLSGLKQFFGDSSEIFKQKINEIFDV